MPTAICECGKTYQWRNQRGSRLADHRCECGKRLRRAVWTPDGWAPAPAKVQREMPQLEACAVCGRRRSVPGGGVRLASETVFHVQYEGEAYRTPEARVVPAGAVVCWSHSPGYTVLVERKGS